MAVQTTLGAARVVSEAGDHPALLEDDVTILRAVPLTESWNWKKAN